MKPLKCKKEFGTYFYEKVMPSDDNILYEPIYELYDENKIYINTFSTYYDMLYYVKTGKIIEMHWMSR